MHTVPGRWWFCGDNEMMFELTSIPSWYMCMYMYCVCIHMEGTHVFLCLKWNATHVVILEGSENVDPLFDIVSSFLLHDRESRIIYLTNQNKMWERQKFGRGGIVRFFRILARDGHKISTMHHDDALEVIFSVHSAMMQGYRYGYPQAYWQWCSRE